MSIVERLFRILKSSLPHGLSGDAGEDTWSHEPHTDSPDVDRHVDPELAGYYANLEVPYGSDLETVRKAWRRLVRKYHPDLHSSDPEKRRVAHELTQGLNHAYRELAKRVEQKESSI